jgi:hypothetical protein
MGFLILDVAEGVGDHREGERDPRLRRGRLEAKAPPSG